jgi:hypothetical protein
MKSCNKTSSQTAYIYGIIANTPEKALYNMGLNFKLDVGTLRLDQQVACQRYRQPILDAKSSTSKMLAQLNGLRDFKLNGFAPALV